MNEIDNYLKQSRSIKDRLKRTLKGINMGTPITGKTLFTVESAITIAIVVVTVTTSFLRSEFKSNQNAQDIAELRVMLSNFRSELKNINKTLNDMLTETRIKNEIDVLKLGDRWTAHMMEIHDNDLLSVLQKYHTEITHKDMPNVLDIQRRDGYGKLYKDYTTENRQ